VLVAAHASTCSVPPREGRGKGRIFTSAGATGIRPLVKRNRFVGIIGEDYRAPNKFDGDAVGHRGAAWHAYGARMHGNKVVPTMAPDGERVAITGPIIGQLSGILWRARTLSVPPPTPPLARPSR